MRDRYVRLLCALFGAASMLWPAAEAAEAQEFSWRALLGKPITGFPAAVRSFASCQHPTFAKADLPWSPGKFVLTGWRTSAPLGGGILDREVQSRIIKQVQCSADKVRIEAFAHLDAVMQIVIEYRRCEGFDCDLVEKDFDRAIAPYLGSRPIYQPYAAPSEDEKARYVEKYGKMADDPYLKAKLDAIGCTDPLLRTGNLDERRFKVQCQLATTQSEGIWHSIGAAELFEKGWFKDTPKGRLVNRQEFALIAAEKRALEDYEAELRSQFEAGAAGRYERRDRLLQEMNKNAPLGVVR